MSERYELLGEMDEAWADMFMEVLKDNGIPCTSMPHFGFAMTAKGGMPEARRIFVPSGCMERARELREEMFSGNGEEALEKLFAEEDGAP